MNKKVNDIIVLGFALFAMFLGVGLTATAGKYVVAKKLINTFLVNVKIVPESNPEALSFETTARVLKSLPFECIGFPWLLPAIAMSLLFGFGYIIMQKAKGSPSMKDNKIENKNVTEESDAK